MARLLYFITEDWFFYSHFLDRASAARRAGYEVVVLTRVGVHGDRLREAGFKVLPLHMERNGMNPLREFGVLWQVGRAYRTERPTLVHHVALKPILYGGLVARCLRVRGVINAPVGMGYLFTAEGLGRRLLRACTQIALRLLLNPRGSKVVFENVDDLRAQTSAGAVQAADAVLIPGAGVDTTVFYPPSHAPRGTLTVLLGARMLRDKGVVEFVEAARLLLGRGVAARFWLVGDVDVQNPSSITRRQLLAWQDEGVVEWLGRRSDMPDLLRQAHLACLPSYREGLPKFLLESMATALPVVSTDVPGCRHAVRHGTTGLLVPPRDPEALALAIERLLGDAPLRATMGARGLERVKDEFSLQRITDMTLQLYAAMRD